MKLLSIAVPCYNSQDYMEKCIESLNPADKRLEIIIVDDGSKDNTGAIADELKLKYPETVVVLHQANGGHGAGILNGLKAATGLYYKTVDSDDVLSSDFADFVDKLESLEKEGGVDLCITNYRYVHPDGRHDKSVTFDNALPQNIIFDWSKTKTFKIDQILMIHTCTFRTEFLRRNNVTLPEHTFYEDNLWICSNLVHTKRLYYMNVDMYLYTIGREGQSVQMDVMTGRYMHQIRITELCFTAFHLSEVENTKLRRYLRHELMILIGAAVLYARRNGTPEAENNLNAMWKTFSAFDKKQKRYYRSNPFISSISIPGKPGSAFVSAIYSLSRKIIPFA